MHRSKAIPVVLLSGGILFILGLATFSFGWENKPPQESCLELLGQVFQEVKELGPFPGQHFIRWDFFIGEGDDDTNKPIHTVVLIQAANEGERMVLQVSRMEPSPANPRVFWNKGTREILARVRGGQVEIVSSDYSTRDMDRFLPTLLLSIRDKKKLLHGRNW